MHAYLVITNDERSVLDEIEKIAKKNESKIVDFTLLKIEDTKELKKITKFSFPSKTAIVIKNINEATNEALNAFLKNLEEPNNNLIYILTAKSIDSVLSTIVSRCEVIKTTTNSISNTDSIDEKIPKFMKLSIDEKLLFIGSIKERNEAVRFVEDIIKLEQAEGSFKYLESALKTLANLKANGNVSLQLTAFVVTMNPAYGR